MKDVEVSIEIVLKFMLKYFNLEVMDICKSEVDYEYMEESLLRELKGKEYIRFESIKHVREDGSEFWSARELGPALEYSKWENFQNVIKRAMIACENSGHRISDDFPEVRKIVEAGAASKPKTDYELTRYDVI